MKKLYFLLILPFLITSCFKEKRSSIAAEKMQDFIVNISNYARKFNNNFIIIPQNGIELTFKNTEPGEGLNDLFMSAINGIGVEELFFDGDYSPDTERLSMLQEIKPSKKIMVSDYLKNDNDFQESENLNSEQGFICFPRISSNYDYLQVPGNTPFSNTNDIIKLDDAQNYLYLISTDNFSSKEEMLTALKATNYDVLLIDLFFDEQALSNSEINQLKTKADGGKRLVIAYMNIGSAEKFRYYWKSGWGRRHPLWVKRKYEGYDDEFWVKFWNDEWQNIIYGNDKSYTRRIIDAGFDGAYLDNVEAYYFIYYRD